jgi:hypothetical protein
LTRKRKKEDFGVCGGKKAQHEFSEVRSSARGEWVVGGLGPKKLSKGDREHISKKKYDTHMMKKNIYNT